MDEFIKTLTEQIRCRKVRDNVAREISDHILDQARAYEESGADHDRAVEMAVHEMGDPVEIGVSLDRIHRPQMNWKMILLTLVLTLTGLLVLYCIYGPSTIVGRQCVFTAAGFAIILAVNFIDYSILGRFGHMAYILLTIAFFIGQFLLPHMNGRIPAMSALVYLYVPVSAGVLYQLRGRGYGAVMMGVVLIFITCIFSVTFSKSLLVGVNIFLILVVMMIMAVRKDMFRVSKKYVTVGMIAVAVLPAAVLGAYILFMAPSFKTERIRGFLHPEQYRTTSGYAYTMIREILGGLKFIGEGNAVGTYAYGYDMTDAISGLVPLNIMYSYGVCAGVALLLLFAVFVIGIVKIVHAQKNQLGCLVSATCFLVLFVNCFEGALMNLGLFPLTTISIPFITRGGSVVLVYSVLIGLLLSVHRYENVITSETWIQRPRWRIRVKLEKE